MSEDDFNIFKLKTVQGCSGLFDDTPLDVSHSSFNRNGRDILLARQAHVKELMLKLRAVAINVINIAPALIQVLSQRFKVESHNLKTQT